MTGDAFIEMMEEKRRVQEEEAEMKEQRKLEREKEKERQKKKEDIDGKRNQRQKRRKYRESRNVWKWQNKRQKKRRKEVAAQKRKEKTGKRKIVQPLELCGRCGCSEADNVDLHWVSCDKCAKWWYIICTDNITCTTVEEFSNITWNCINCREEGNKTWHVHEKC